VETSTYADNGRIELMACSSMVVDTPNNLGDHSEINERHYGYRMDVKEIMCSGSIYGGGGRDG
jgi:hypothetical protein